MIFLELYALNHHSSTGGINSIARGNLHHSSERDHRTALLPTMSSGTRSCVETRRSSRRSSTSTTSNLYSTLRVKNYRRTREEAIACSEPPLPIYELFDMNTGAMKEKYRRARSPSPTCGTIVYEIGTGRPYEYVSGTELLNLNLGSQAMSRARREAIEAGVWSPPPPLPQTTTTTVTTTRSESLSTARRERTDGSSVSIGVCSCVSLVTSEPVSIDMRAPDLVESDGECDEGDEESRAETAESKLLLERSPTLRFLRAGYRNYVENGRCSAEPHRLAAYSCHSVRSKLYNSYKSITCRRGVPSNVSRRTHEHESRDSTPRSLSLHHRTMATINQYMSVFSTLADFNYNWILPDVGRSALNAIVVDKLWTYNHIRRIHMPYYRLLVGDGYTDLFVGEVLKIKNRGIPIRHVRFLSTPNTRLYTNRLSLLARATTATASTSASATSTGTTSGAKRRIPDTATEENESTLPFKKRCSVSEPNTTPAVRARSQKERTATSGSSSSGGGASSSTYVLSTRDWPAIEHRAGCSRDDSKKSEKHGGQSPSTSAACSDTPENRSSYREELQQHPREEETAAATTTVTIPPVKNPTLVVFKHNLNEREPDTLLCNIVVELHLGDVIRY